jgi:hypothetical protein
MDHLVQTLLVAARGLTERLRRRHGEQDGAITLELVILVVGLLALAALLVAALTNAVRSRTEQLN